MSEMLQEALHALDKDAPRQSPVVPLKLTLDDTIQFNCHPGVSCFNQCCRHIDITLTPYDIHRLKTRLGLGSVEFLEKYTVPFELDSQGMPGVKLRTASDTTICPFLTEQGCGVYEDRPTVCRYYALGLMSMRATGASQDEDLYFLVKEDYCKGHEEPRKLTIREYRQEQGVEIYDEMNRGWRQVVLKKRSSGPAVGRPSERSYQLFFVASYNLDGFRDFIMSPGFSQVYDLDGETLQSLREDDIALLHFAARLLKQVLFGEVTIPLRADAEENRRQRMEQQQRRQREEEARRREEWDMGHDEPVEL